ncbi:MAG: DUF6790 family protein [Alcaligenaceae bacterium]
MEQIIKFLLQNFGLTFFVIGLIFSVYSILMARKKLNKPSAAENLIKWFVFFSIGVSCLYNGIMHTVFSEAIAKFIGWPDSPFQQEVGFASFGFSLIGFIAFKGSWQTKLCAIAGPSCFLLGAAGGHIYQMITAGNFAPGNAGVVFYMDILLPIVGWVLLYLSRHSVTGDKS